MNTEYRSEIDTVPLLERIKDLVGPKWHKDSTGVLMSNKQSYFWPSLAAVCFQPLKEISLATGLEVKYLLVNVIHPGITAPPHTDTLKTAGVFRYHLPLNTNPDAWVWEEGRGFRNLCPGWWHNVNYKFRHAVGNFGLTARTHLIVDLVEKQ